MIILFLIILQNLKWLSKNKINFSLSEVIKVRNIFTYLSRYKQRSRLRIIGPKWPHRCCNILVQVTNYAFMSF